MISLASKAISPVIVKIACKGSPHIVLMLIHFCYYILCDVQILLFRIFLG